MNRIFKFIVAILATLVLLVVIAAALLPRLIDPNNYRDDISRLVHDNTGLTLSINGSIGWSVFPWVGLSLEDVSVTGSNGSMLGQLGSAEVSVKLLPLLSKRIEMQTATLQGLELTLVKEKGGRGNWQVEKPLSASSEKKGKPPQTPDAPKQNGKQKKLPLLELNIASIEVANLLVSFDDRQTGKQYTIDQASLTTGAIEGQAPFDFKLAARISTPDLAMNSIISGRLKFNLQEGLYDVENLNISARPDVAQAEQLSITGNLHYQQSPTQARGQLDVTPFNLARLLSQIKVQLPPMADAKALSHLSINSQFQTDGKRFSADSLKLQLDDFKVKGRFKVTDLERQTIKFSFTGNDLDLDRYLPPSTEKEGREPSANKEPFANKEPSANKEHSSKKEPAPSQKTSQGKQVAKELPLIPEDMLRGLNLDGSLKLSSLTAAKLRFDQPSVTLKAASGRQNIAIGSAFYQGQINLDSTLDVRTRGLPKATASASLKGISLEGLSKPVPALKLVQGNVNADINISTRGQLQSELTRNLNGKVQFRIKEGTFKGANFDKLVCEGIATIRKTNLAKAEWGSSTQFKDLSGIFIITNGVAVNSDLVAVLSNLNLKGDGNINLLQQTLDYHVLLNIRGNEAPDSDPACQVNEDYVDVTWPVRCRGALGKPHCGIDTERLADTIASLLRKEAQGHLKKEIEDKVQGPFKDFLKGWFK